MSSTSGSWSKDSESKASFSYIVNGRPAFITRPQRNLRYYEVEESRFRFFRSLSDVERWASRKAVKAPEPRIVVTSTALIWAAKGCHPKIGLLV